jgi:oligosaccharide repeat unit polymerase
VSAESTMWKRIICPEVLFGFASLSALLPYLFLDATSDNLLGDYATNLTYRPIWVWGAALLAFLAGCAGATATMTTSAVRNETRYALLSSKRVMLALLMFAVVAIVQVILAIQFLGVIPLLTFASGYSVEELHERLTDSPSGQFGLLTLTSFVLAALVVCLTTTKERWTSFIRFLVLLSLGLAVFIGLFLGKAQGYVIQLSLLLSACILLHGHPLNPILVKLGFRPLSQRTTVAIFVIGLIAFLFLFALTRSLRLGDAGSIFEVDLALQAPFQYLAWPLINTEEIVQHQGFGEPLDFGFFQGLLPYRFAERDEFLLSILAEPSSPVGLAGYAVWYGGLLGVVAYCAILGFALQAIYRTAPFSISAALIYAQASWALIAANLYNHFVNLIFFPLPALIYLVIVRLLALPEERHAAILNTRSS